MDGLSGRFGAPQTHSDWWAGLVAGSADFVGREHELSSLRGALGGDTRLLLVTGDAGVGKTRFVAEGMRSAAAGGMVSVLGGCLPLAGKLPLLPVADALGELSRLDHGRLLEAALDTVLPYVRMEVARLLPQLGIGELGLGSRGEGWQQERLFSAVAELLGAVTGRSGLGVVIEDVHWADSATLDCLTYLARPGRRTADHGGDVPQRRGAAGRAGGRLAGACAWWCRSRGDRAGAAVPRSGGGADRRAGGRAGARGAGG